MERAGMDYVSPDYPCLLTAACKLGFGGVVQQLRRSGRRERWSGTGRWAVVGPVSLAAQPPSRPPGPTAQTPHRG